MTFSDLFIGIDKMTLNIIQCINKYSIEHNSTELNGAYFLKPLGHISEAKRAFLKPKEEKFYKRRNVMHHMVYSLFIQRR